MHKVSKSVNINLKRYSIKASGWDAAIGEAEKQLMRVNNRASRLRKVIEDFKALQQHGIS